MSSRNNAARSSAPDFLNGGGDMGALMRAHDWASTPLGAPSGWPRALKTAVRLILNTGHPMYIWWGPDLLCFYNDAYRHTLGPERHPGSLGQPGREVWAEIWHLIGHQVDFVMAGGGSTWDENRPVPITRFGRLDEIYWTYSYSPIDDETSPGGIGGVLVVCTETTKAVLAERRRTVEMERLSRMFQQAPGFMAMLVGPEHVFELTNAAYLQLVGHRDVLGKSVREALPEIEGQGFFELLDRVYATDEPYSGRAMSVTLQRTPGAPVERRFVDLVYQPITDAGGAVTGIFVEGYDVTEQVIAQTDLRESEERNRRIVEGVKDHAIFTTDREGRIVDWTPGAEAVFGWPKSEIGGKNSSLLFTPEDRAADVPARELAEAREKGYAKDERWHVRRDGSRFVANGSVRPLHSADGQIAGFLKIARDETQRLATDAAMRKSDERYRTLFEALDAGFCIAEIKFDADDRATDYRLTEINPAFERQTGLYGAAGKWVSEAAPNLERHWFDTYGRVALTGEAVRFENRAEPLGRWYDVHAFRIGEAEDRRVAILFNDISARKAAEDRLRELNETLERQVSERTADRDRMWRLSTDIMIVARFEGTINAVNPAWTSLLGWKQVELVGANFLDFVHPDDRTATIAEMGKLDLGITTFRFENRYRAVDGSYRWFSWTAVPSDGLVHAVGRDVSAEKAQAEALAHAEEALRQAQKMEAIGQLTGGVAHDFNNLLTVIRSSADLLRRPGLNDERRARYVDAIAVTADRAAALTRQLLAFARRQALKAEVFDAAARVNGVADMLRTVLGSRVELTIDSRSDASFVEADPGQFETALVNLAVNARDAMGGEGRLAIALDKAGATPALRALAGTAGEFVAVSVTDTGTGIPPELVARIFEPFFTTKEIGAGTGLGLSQVFGFAKQSGGEIDVETEVGRGSTFTLYLPRAERPAPSTAVTKADKVHAGYGRVLVVEDNAQVRDFAAQLLGDLGYVTELAPNATEALRLLERHGDTFDVVFSDVVMPGLGGVEFGRQVRARWPALPVVLTSGYSHILAEDARHGFQLLQKPYSVEDLSNVLRDATAIGGRGAKGHPRER
jgi:PAS domain S-box-containing protein